MKYFHSLLSLLCAIVIRRRGGWKESHIFTSTNPYMPAAGAVCLNLVTQRGKRGNNLQCKKKKKIWPWTCVLVRDDSSQRPVWTATMPAVAVDPLIRPNEDTLWSLCSSTWPFTCSEKTSGCELMAIRWRLTAALAQTLMSGGKKNHRWH